MSTYFKARNNFSIGKRHEHGCHVSITRRRDKAATKLVASSGIKSSRD